MKKNILAATLCMGLAWVACKKNEAPGSKPVTSMDLITASAWKIDSIGLDVDKNGTIDSGVPGGFEACDLDNTLQFNTDSTGVYDDGALKCYDTIPQSIPFRWYLTGNDKIINIAGNLPGQLSGDVSILTLTDSTLVVYKEIPIDGSAPTTVNLVISLKK